MSRAPPPWLPRVFVESFLIVASILVALAVNEWWEGRERRQQLRVALTAMRAELAANVEEVREAAEYHQMLEDTLRALTAVRATRVPGDVYPRGLLRGVAVSGTAWETARASGVLSDLPFGNLLALSRAYAGQALYLKQKQDLLHMLYVEVFREGGDLIDRRYPQYAGIISDVAGWERTLVRQYETALAAVDSALGLRPGGAGVDTTRADTLLSIVR